MCLSSCGFPSSGCFCKRSHATRGLRDRLLAPSSCSRGSSVPYRCQRLLRLCCSRPSIVWLRPDSAPCSSVGGRSGCLHFGAIVKNVALNTGVALFEHLLRFSRCVSRSGISASRGNSVFNLWRNCQSAFHSSCAVLPPQRHI